MAGRLRASVPRPVPEGGPLLTAVLALEVAPRVERDENAAGGQVSRQMPRPLVSGLEPPVHESHGARQPTGVVRDVIAEILEQTADKLIRVIGIRPILPMGMRVAQEEERAVAGVSPRCFHAAAFQSRGNVADIG